MSRVQNLNFLSFSLLSYYTYFDQTGINTPIEMERRRDREKETDRDRERKTEIERDRVSDRDRETQCLILT